MKNIEIEIGNRIKDIRIKSGYTREQLSEMVNISSKFLYEIETGKKGMSAYTLYNISLALNVTCDYIMKGTLTNNNTDYIINILSSMTDDDIYHIEQIMNHIVELKKNR